MNYVASKEINSVQLRHRRMAIREYDCALLWPDSRKATSPQLRYGSSGFVHAVPPDLRADLRSDILYFASAASALGLRARAPEAFNASFNFSLNMGLFPDSST